LQEDAPVTVTLFGYARSSAAFRVRIALNLKNLDHVHESLNLRAGGQLTPSYLNINPQGLVPALIDGDAVLTQSLAIIEYLDETRPAPPLMPATPVERARVRALALVVASDLHPLNNLRVLDYLTRDLGLDEDRKLRWYRHWIARGLTAFEALVDGHPATGAFCHGDGPTLADICLVPQIFNAQRFQCPLDSYPTMMRIFDACMTLPAFDRAQPAQQPDAGD
jgi:maleylacetoacetate isomerase